MRHRVTPPLPYGRPDAVQPEDGSRRVSSGGPPFQGRYRRTNRSVSANMIVAANSEFWKTRGPFFTTGNSYPIADTIRSSEIPPIRPSMRMATGSYRQWGGNTNTHFKGYHTYLAEVNETAKSQGTQKGGMRAARQNRLTIQRYRGQTYSQTTQVLGS